MRGMGERGARGTVGQFVVKAAISTGHFAVRINRTEQESDDTSNSEFRTADTANDYYATVKVFKGMRCGHSSRGHHRSCRQEELGIKKICYSYWVNATGLAYADQPLRFKYFPIAENYPPNPTDAYALAKIEIAGLRIHEVAPKKDVQKEHEENWDALAVGQLWAWVNPAAVARACLLGVEKADVYGGCQVFNILAPGTMQRTPSTELARKYYPEAERETMHGDDVTV
ncbi:hypothetical protein PMIN07_009703 [Paraphaeosphaeria minitans]